MSDPAAASPMPRWRHILKAMSRQKTVDMLLQQLDGEQSELKRTLGTFDLCLMGLGVIIGSGIFVVSGTAASQLAGPSLVISVLIAGFASMLCAFSYAELSTMVPVVGASSYTFVYATMGEFLAFLIGWVMTLEWLVGCAAVAVGWSSYIVRFFQDAFNVTFSQKTTVTPVYWDSKNSSFKVHSGAIINIPAMFIVLATMAILCVGATESKMVNNVVTTVKIVVILVFIFGSIKYINKDNYKPFVPPTEDGSFGTIGVFKGAQQFFFAFIGFDALASAAQESKCPQRDLPISIVVSLIVCTLLYGSMVVVLTGLTKYTNLNTASPATTALDGHPNTRWLRILVGIGAIAGLTTVTMVMQMVQSRIWVAISRDGLLPKAMGYLSPRFKTPINGQLICGIIAAIIAAFLPVDILSDLTSLAALLSYFLVHVSVIVLRFTQPHANRGFYVPLSIKKVPVWSVLGAIICVLLFVLSGGQNILRTVIWIAIGIVIYFAFSIRHSHLGTSQPTPHPAHDMSSPDSTAICTPKSETVMSKEDITIRNGDGTHSSKPEDFS
ncbi:hypothetical protein GGI12_000942 [Dipsacomyces acuminosporus]|nr:hypothetical protein GGI12_000942 [Dipsacomyces acuminosporus]